MHEGLVVYTSGRLEHLLEALAAQLAGSPLPPLVAETIVVPGQGMARWLQLRLAEKHRIAAGLHLPFPGAFLQQLGRSAGAGPDLFLKDVLGWRIWRLLGETAHQEALGPAAAYCGDDPDGRKRFQLCQRLAACFDDYQLYRDDLLLRCRDGDDLEDQGPHGPWQANLWRALLRDAGLLAAPATPSRRGRRRPEATPLMFEELRQEPAPSGPGSAHRLEQLRLLLADAARARRVLPPRLSVFGAGTLPPAFLDLLHRIAAVVPVSLFVPRPTPQYAGDLGRRSTAGGNPLLARLGAEAREFTDQLVDLEAREGPAPVQHVELDGPGDTEPVSLLACLQQDIAEVRERCAPELFRIRDDDDSLRVHDCHSPQRELEVVRDQILAAFADDPQLEPHDVLVLVPDIDRYAPFAHAVFGPVADHLPFHVADRSPASEQPLCASLFAVLQIALDRLAVHDVLHLLEEPAVQRRFGLFAGDLPVLRDRCERAGIRWGLDGASRQRQFRVPAFEENAWAQGLDRLLLGVATGPVDDLVAGVLPVADTTDGRSELLARFVGFLRTLFERLQPLQRPHPLPVWADLVDGLLDCLYSPASADDEATLAQVRKATAGLRSVAAASRVNEPISPIVLQDWLRTALQQSTGSRGFLAGAVTIAAMLPMRMVPVKCLFLCGLDDQSFPRRDRPAPFDLIAAARRPGDRSPRLDDRQMFLDALLAARQRLHLTFVGHSQKDDSECAPSVVLAELLDLVDRSCEAPAGHEQPRDLVVVRHPLQPWSQRYRTGDDARLFTFSRDDQQPAATTAVDEAPWCGAPIAPLPELPAELPLERLREFWWHPCRFFLTHSMHVRVRSSDDVDADTEPFAVEPLDRWRLQDQAVRRALRGEPPPADPLAHARATGLLPVGGHGAAAFTAVDDEAQQFLHEVLGHGRLGRVPLVVHAQGCTIRGELEGVGERELVYARIAKLKNKDRLRAWLLHVLAAVARRQGATDLPAQTRVIAKDCTVVLGPLPEEVASAELDWLLAGYREGLVAPLPFFEKSSYAYAKAQRDHDDPAASLRKARREWLPRSTDTFSSCDSEDPAIALCMRGRQAPGVAGFEDWAERIWATALVHSVEQK